MKINKTPIQKAEEFGFQKPAVYKIKVQGEINGSLANRLGGLQINVNRSKSNTLETVLIGQINDQAALSGLLTTLYDFHIPIISVNMLHDDPSDKA
jgi:hypothetical protein